MQKIHKALEEESSEDNKPHQIKQIEKLKEHTMADGRPQRSLHTNEKTVLTVAPPTY